MSDNVSISSVKPNSARLVEILVNGKWLNRAFTELKHGNTFRMFESGSFKPVNYLSQTVFKVKGHIFYKHGMPTVNIEDLF